MAHQTENSIVDLCQPKDETNFQIILEEHFHKLEDHLDDMEEEIQKYDDLLSEDLRNVTVAANEVESEVDNMKMTLKDIARKENSYSEALFNNIGLSGVRNVFLRRFPDLYSSVSILFHIVALFVSAIYIQDAYNNFRNSLIVQSLTYMNVKDIPFPAITVCEPVLLKDEYNRFEILRRCMSVENETSWLCSEDELNMFMISTDIYPIAFDLLPMAKEEGFLFSALYIPLFEDKDIKPNRVFSGVDYIKYIEKLGKERLSTLQIYNHDFPTSPYRLETLRNGSTSSDILLAPNIKYAWGIYTCKTINAMKNPRRVKSRDGSKPKDFDESLCNPGNIFDGICKNELLYTDNHLELEFADLATDIEFKTKFPKVVYKWHEDKFLDLVAEKIKFENYILFVHNNFDYPSMSVTPEQRITRCTSAAISVSPNITNARKDLAEVEESKRNCVFSHERSLSLFEFYTQNNCVFECQINCSLTLCGCIPHGTAIFNSPLPICSSIKATECQDQSKFLLKREYKDERCNCDCPLDCLTVSYSIDKSFEVEPDALPKQMNTTIQFSYEKDSVISVIRYSVTSPAEFVAYSLGILGVFNGFSIKVVYELFYWLTLGLWFTIGDIAVDI